MAVFVLLFIHLNQFAQNGKIICIREGEIMVNSKKSSAKQQTKKPVRAKRVKRAPINPVVASVNRMYNRGVPLLIGEALLFVAAAAVLFIKPVLVLTIFTYIIGTALLLFGLYRMITGFVASNDNGGGGIDVVFGLINIVLGLLFIVYPAGSLVSVAYIFVVLFFFKALRVLIFAINLARARFGHYLITLLAAMILFGLAVALFFFPLGTFIAMTYYLAVLLVVYAVADIYMFVELNKLRQLVSD